MNNFDKGCFVEYEKGVDVHNTVCDNVVSARKLYASLDIQAKKLAYPAAYARAESARLELVKAESEHAYRIRELDDWTGC